MDNNENLNPTPASDEKQKLVAGLLAIFLGWLGIHKFYLGYQKEAIIMLCCGVLGFIICGIPTSVVSIIGIIEGILYLTKSDADFKATYVDNKKPWF
ncbi:MAG: TM2 domain-containing protein [Victivallales bacterium]|nr:TM2 domain-containing protein [Victivallales bacterium]